MQVIDNRGLLLRTRNPQRITTVIPKAKQVGEHEVLVKWGLEEAQVLKNLNIKNVPSPILGQYEWPGLYKPFEHQKKTASFLTLHRRAFCFNEQGTGKTSSVIWAADYLMTQGVIKRVLVVCPLSIMQAAWQNDLFKFAMHRTCAIAHAATREKRLKAINSDAEFVIINYDGLALLQEEIRAAEFDLVVADEASALKTATTTRWKAFYKVLKSDAWLWLLTGTPAAQSPTDAYGLAKLVNPNNVPKFFSAFRDQTMIKLTQFKWAPRHDAKDIVHSVLQPAIRFTKDECLDLPDMTYATRVVPLTKQQLKYYEIVRKQMVASAAGETITTVNAAANLNTLLQISCGAAYTDNDQIIEFDASNRMEEMLSVIRESSHKTLVFAPYTHVIESIKRFLDDNGVTAEIINGDVPLARRTDTFNRFQITPDPQVLIIQPQAAAHGVTLTAANTIIWFGPITSVETYLQANARVHRAGQRNPCTVIHLQGSPAEKRMYAMLQSKVDIHSSLIEMYSNIVEEHA